MNEATEETEATKSTESLPDEIHEITGSIIDSFLSIWGNFIEHTPYILGTIIVVLITWLIAKIGLNIARRSLRHAKMRESLKDLLLRFLSIGIWTMGILFAAMILFPGLTPSKALGALGLVSIAVGLAFKDIFENFFAGILLLWRFPFENGDYIECEGVVGYVEKIEIRVSMIRKDNGELVVVPNSFLFKNPVNVLTNKSHRRITLTTGIAYDENIKEAIDVITQSISGCETVLHDLPLQVWPSAFGSSSIDIEVTWWTKPEPVDIRRSTGEVITTIKKALDDNGIEIPFPYRTLTFKEPLVIQKNQGS